MIQILLKSLTVRTEQNYCTDLIGINIICSLVMGGNVSSFQGACTSEFHIFAAQWRINNIEGVKTVVRSNISTEKTLIRQLKSLLPSNSLDHRFCVCLCLCTSTITYYYASLSKIIVFTLYAILLFWTTQHDAFMWQLINTSLAKPVLKPWLWVTIMKYSLVCLAAINTPGRLNVTSISAVKSFV